MFPSIMDITRARRREAEIQIAEILKKLQEDTDMSILHVRVDTAGTMEGTTVVIDVTIEMGL